MNERMLNRYLLPFIERHIAPNRRERMAFLLRRGDSDALDLARAVPGNVLRRESIHPVYFRWQDGAQAVRALRERGAGETVCVVDLFHADAWERSLAEGVEEVLDGLSMMAVSLNGETSFFKGENYDEQYLIY